MSVNLDGIEEVGTSDFCRNFPDRPIKNISRDNFYDHIETVLNEAAKCVIIEGDLQSGKTEFLAGYMRRHPQLSVGVFLSPGNSYFYSPEYVKIVLAEQINWIVNGKAGNFDAVDNAEYKSLLYKLQKIAKISPITFILDGLVEKSSPEGRLKSDILELMPFGQSDFRFLISGTQDTELAIRAKCKSIKSVTLIPIAQEEASEYFSDVISLSSKDISDIRRFCGGSIGRMAKLKSVLQLNRISLNDILTGKSADFDDLMNIEWEEAQSSGDITFLSFLCFSNRPLSLDELSDYAEVSTDELKKICLKNSFVAFDQKAGNVSLRSDLEKKYLKKRFSLHEKNVQQKITENLLKEPESAEADRHLPMQLLQIGKHDDLLQRLNTKHFCRVFSREKSLRTLRVDFDLGIRAAKEKNYDHLVTQFGFSKCVIGGLALSVGSEGRLRVLVGMGQVDEAISLAIAAPTGEERLKQLALVAKTLFDERKPITKLLKDEISSLLAEFNAETLGENAIPIACDLLPVDLKAASILFQNANGMIKRQESELTEKSGVENQEDSNKPKNFGGKGEIDFRISQKHQHRFAHVLGQIVDRTPPEIVKKKLQQSENLPENLLLAKEWIARRKTDPDACGVANSAVDALLKDLTRSPRLEDLRMISLVLPHMENLTEAEKLSKRIQALSTTDLFVGTSVEAVRLNMLLAETEYRIRPEEAELAVLEILMDVEGLEDISIKATCLSWILHALKQFRHCDVLESKTSLISHTTKSLMQAIETLLANSADHLGAVKTALPALARADSKMALDVCRSLNIESRRDAAFAILLTEVAFLKQYSDNPSTILSCINSIQDELIRSQAIIGVLSIASDHIKHKQSRACNAAVLNLWRKLKLSNYRFMALRYVLHISLLLDFDDTKIKAIHNDIEQCWRELDIDWVRWDLGYNLIRDCYQLDKSYATNFLELIGSEEREVMAPSASFNDVLRMIASLAIRAYSYIADEGEQEKEDFKKLSQLMSVIAVPDERLQLWCEFGIRLHYAGKRSLSTYISKVHVEEKLPILGDTENQFGCEITYSLAAPLLYIVHEATGQFIVDKIKGSARRDGAISNICLTLMRRVAISDAYKKPGSEGYVIDAATVASILSLIEKMKTDWLIFNIVESLALSISARKNERSFRRTQAADFLTTLEDLCRQKLPDDRNIKHDGFLISSLALIGKARHAIGVPPSQAMWTKLYTEARSLSNVSDRAVVTTFVAIGAKSKSPVIPEDWLVKVRADVDACPTVLDRIDRCSWIAEIMEDFDKKNSLIFARQGMTLTNDVGPDVNIFEKKQKLLDIVFNIDPELAEDFIELSDSDRARKNDKAALKARVKLKQLQKEAATDPDKVNLNEESDKDIAELSLRNLASLNANRIPPRPVDDFKQILTRAPTLPFEDAYCVWSWALENAVRKAAPNSNGERVVSAIFKASLIAGELIVSLLGGAVDTFGARGKNRLGIISPGDRESAMKGILDWAGEVDGQCIYITDPYFCPEDVDFVYEICKAAPKSEVRVLTGRRQLKKVASDGDFESAFTEAWRAVCDVTPSDIEISVIGCNADGDHPIHDRWIIGENSGLRLGTSVHSLGATKVSELSVITGLDSIQHLTVLKGLLDRKVKEWDGQRISLTKFYLT